MAGTVITLYLPRETLERIETVASSRGDNGTCAPSRASEIEAPGRAVARAEALRGVQERLRPALAAQGEFLDTFSISDEWRTF